MKVDVLVINAQLPQTQCGECGFSGCLPYAQALAEGVTSIDRCPPGGTKTLHALAGLLKLDATPYQKAVLEKTRAPSYAVIREAECIGCTKCIQACPVDAIVGSAKWMHSVINSECTGCGLCVAPCPVDCIDMVTIDEVQYDKKKAQLRAAARESRMQRDAADKERHYRSLAQKASEQEIKAKQAYILEALARVQAKKNG